MRVLKNIGVGFLVSFLGSLPLGYLNVFGYEIYTQFGLTELTAYLLGILAVEVFVIYFTLLFAYRLANNRKLMKAIELFSVFFLLVLAYVFHSQSGGEPGNHNYLGKYIGYPAFVIGVMLNAVNFLQLPFWTGWNLYLLNANYISVEKKGIYFYVFGTLVGIFTGMLAMVLCLDLVAANSRSISRYLFSHLIPLFFIGLAIFQAYKFYKKYYASPKG